MRFVRVAALVLLVTQTFCGKSAKKSSASGSAISAAELSDMKALVKELVTEFDDCEGCKKTFFAGFAKWLGNKPGENVFRLKKWFRFKTVSPDEFEATVTKIYQNAKAQPEAEALLKKMNAAAARVVMAKPGLIKKWTESGLSQDAAEDFFTQYFILRTTEVTVMRRLPSFAGEVYGDTVKAYSALMGSELGKLANGSPGVGLQNMINLFAKKGNGKSFVQEFWTNGAGLIDSPLEAFMAMHVSVRIRPTLFAFAEPHAALGVDSGLGELAYDLQRWLKGGRPFTNRDPGSAEYFIRNIAGSIVQNPKTKVLAQMPEWIRTVRESGVSHLIMNAAGDSGPFFRKSGSRAIFKTVDGQEFSYGAEEITNGAFTQFMKAHFAEYEIYFNSTGELKGLLKGLLGNVISDTTVAIRIADDPPPPDDGSSTGDGTQSDGSEADNVDNNDDLVAFYDDPNIPVDYGGVSDPAEDDYDNLSDQDLDDLGITYDDDLGDQTEIADAESSVDDPLANDPNATLDQTADNGDGSDQTASTDSTDTGA